MNTDEFERLSKELMLAEDLLNIRIARQASAKGHSVHEAREILTQTVNSAGENK